LVQSKVDVIVTHTTQGVRAAKGATTTIPIVIATVADAVAAGLVDSLAHPGGNVTGLSFFDGELMAKRLEFFQEIAPSDREAAVLFNPDNPANALILRTMETTSKALRVDLHSFEVREPSQYEETFSAIANRKIHLAVVQDDPIFVNSAKAIAAVALRRRLATCGFGELAKAGGLLAYGVDFDAMFYRAAAFVDKLLKGASPSDLPVEQPTKFELVVNLKTAKALDLTIPPSILARADEVIE
jgi:putative ABC transport system substrate-binding protein